MSQQPETSLEQTATQGNSQPFQLEILTPERSFFSGPVKMVVLPLEDGEYGILKGHAPMVAALSFGSARLLCADGWKEAFISEGIAMVGPEQTTLMAQLAEWPEDIDAVLAQEEIERQEERLRQKQSMREYVQSKTELTRAMARLRITRTRTGNTERDV